ncbi:hypothetical protein M2139_002128 [Enterococcus sp. PF1-24]|uniref:DUF4153 domain-containing protein n=1 Tax=unclassified Enterococcus TaxID=2608891 RepID=UPI0024764F10|nr:MULTISPECIES: DUF4153 domain-containing protein [unclassified Enterococcus]MDH6365127.1 hypothetical protein [Enterococcus sp. PFB1-1]MDH6402228.1 hypothetical protein [Enterococcus sp. PF1-24]
MEKIIKAKKNYPPLLKFPEHSQLKGQDLIFAGISIITAFAMIRGLMQHMGGILITGITFIFCSSILFYLKSKNLKLSTRQFAYFAYVLLLGASFAVFKNRVLLKINLFFLIFSCLYWVLTIVGARKNNTLDQHFFSDLLYGIFITPFRKLNRFVHKIKWLRYEHHNLKLVLLAIAISLPILSLVIYLLTFADQQFEAVISYLTSALSENLGEYFFSLLLAIPLGSYLFLLVYRNINSSQQTRKQLTIKTGPNIFFMTILILFITVYLLFFASAYVGYRLTDTYQLEENARQGFFQLLPVALINVTIFAIIKNFSNYSKSIQIGLTLIGLETLGLIWLGLAQMFLYIQYYGLTILRFNTTWFMIALFICMMIFIAALWKKFNYTKGTVLFLAAVMLILSWGNSGKIITNYNYQQFQTGQLKKLDSSVFYDIVAEAVPTAIEIYQESEDEDLREEMFDYLLEMQTLIEEDSSFTLQQYLDLKKLTHIIV